MIFDLKPYPAMKDSGVPWLGQVPEYWEMLPNRAIFVEVKEREHPEEQMLSVTITKGVIPQQKLLADSSKKDSSNQDKSAYKVVRPGDIAYNKMHAWQGAIGVSDYQGIVSPAYVVQRPRDGAHPRYFHYLLRTPSFAKEAERWSYGITSDMWSLRPEHFKMIYGCLPSPNEQATIVRYLDHMDRRIRKYIRAKQKLIKLLEEQKQAIIHRAVTRGLDPNVLLKPSGIEWLGKVPEHWEVGPLKRFVARRPGAIKAGPFGSQLTAAEMVGSDVKVYTQRNVIDRDLDGGVNYVSYAKFETMRAFQVFSGDVLVTSRGTIGRTALVTENCQLGILHPCLLRVQPDVDRLIPEFLMMLIQDSQLLPQQLTLLSNATTIDVIYSGTLANIIVPVPLKDEQHAIFSAVVLRTASIAAARSRAQSEISLLREYRTRLIADVVTGKLDVREAAAQLPDETDEPEPSDEADALSDAEEETEVVEEPEE